MNHTNNIAPVLEVKDLSISYSNRHLPRQHIVRAVRHVSFNIYPGDCFALVGESTCGKTSIINAILRFIRPDTGSILFEGTNITKSSEKDLQFLRPLIQPVFQDFQTALNPRLRIQTILEEALRVRQTNHMSIEELLSSVGLYKDITEKYPHQLSGGQKQRVVIARALCTGPTLLLLDEPTSSLDISVAVQIVDLLKKLQKSQGLSFLIVSHDLAIVRLLANRIAIMKDGNILEEQPTEQLFRQPESNYTKTLLNQIVES